jgi:hypothetical protein
MLEFEAVYILSSVLHWVSDGLPQPFSRGLVQQAVEQLAV